LCSYLFTLHSAKLEYLNIFIAMGPFESLLIPTGLFKKISSQITQRKMIFIEVKQNMSSAEALSYTVLYIHYRMEIIISGIV